MVGVEVLEGIELILVDDEPGILRALSLLLGSLKCKVSAHPSPVEALAYLATGPRRSPLSGGVYRRLRCPDSAGLGRGSGPEKALRALETSG